MPTTYTGKGGQPYFSQKEADLSYASKSPGQYTDRETGEVYNSEYAMKDAQWEREHRGW